MCRTIKSPAGFGFLLLCMFATASATWAQAGHDTSDLRKQQSGRQAKAYEFCYVVAADRHTIYFSGAFHRVPTARAAITAGFVQFLKQNYSFDGQQDPTCPEPGVETEDQIKAGEQAQIEGNRQDKTMRVIETGWRYNDTIAEHAAAPPPPPAPATPTPQPPSTPARAATGAAPPRQYAMCYTNFDPHTAYFSEVFRVDNQNQTLWQQGFASFLLEKYHFRGPVLCGGGMPSDKQERHKKQLIDVYSRTQKVVETGWKYESTSGGNAPAPQQRGNAAEITGVYIGNYQCPRGLIGLKLTLVADGGASLTGTFTFDLPPGSTARTGSFTQNGTYDAATDKFRMDPGKWVPPVPSGFAMVGLDGAFNPNTAQVSGQINGPYKACTTFQATRDAAQSASFSNPAATPAARLAAATPTPQPPSTPAPPAVAAEPPGLYAWCRATYDPHTAYFSDIFKVTDNSTHVWTAAYGNFIRQKYHIDLQGVVCGGSASLDKQVGYKKRLTNDYPKIVETGWRYSDTIAAPAPPPPAAASNAGRAARGPVSTTPTAVTPPVQPPASSTAPQSSQAAGGSGGGSAAVQPGHFAVYCSSDRTQPVIYFSDIFDGGPLSDRADRMMVQSAETAFFKYLKSKYSYKDSSNNPTSCTTGQIAAVKADRDRVLALFKGQNQQIIETGWKYAP